MPRARENSEQLRPAQIAARRIKEARKSRGWTQEQLSERLGEVGYPKTREVLTKLESGSYRGVSIDDMFGLAAALGVFPVHLLTPLEDEATVAVTNRVQLSAAAFRDWIRGAYRPPILPDVEVDYRQVPKAELTKAVERWLLRQWNLTPLTRALMGDEFEAAVTRHVEELRNPKKRKETPDG